MEKEETHAKIASGNIKIQKTKLKIIIIIGIIHIFNKKNNNVIIIHFFTKRSYILDIIFNINQRMVRRIDIIIIF